jgi:predicted Fe-Mo cluster-binding NifX family protein
MVRIAIPIWNERISPVLDSCARLVVFDVVENKVVDRKEAYLGALSVFERSSLMKKLDIEVVICGAVSEVFCQALESNLIYMVCGITGDVEQALDAFLGNRLNDPRFRMPGYQNA